MSQIIKSKYITEICKIFKKVAFHEMYVQKCRQQLCDDEYYNPMSAFKSIASFKHDKIIAYQLFSFFQLHRIQSTVQQCLQIIQSLNKIIQHIDYDNFEELTLPMNIKLRNLSRCRYNKLKVEIGTYSLVGKIKENSQLKIALFFEKQLKFIRQHKFLCQQFCRQFGGDCYTLFQELLNSKMTNIKYQIWNNISRAYGIFFNPDEFKALWKRSKRRPQQAVDYGKQQTIEREHLISLVLTHDFHTKQKYLQEKNIPLWQIQTKLKPPSYKNFSIERQKLEQAKQKASQQHKKISYMMKDTSFKMKYKFMYPDQQLRSIPQLTKLRNMNDQINQVRNKMTSAIIDIETRRQKNTIIEAFFIILL